MKYIANPVEVEAFSITGIGENLGENFGLNVTVDDGSTRLITPEQMARMTPAVGDYFVIQSDSYIYINPKAVFERKYHAAPPESSALLSGHGKVVCSCGTVMAQCRCMENHGAHKVIQNGCDACKAKLRT